MPTKITFVQHVRQRKQIARSIEYPSSSSLSLSFSPKVPKKIQYCRRSFTSSHKCNSSISRSFRSFVPFVVLPPGQLLPSFRPSSSSSDPPYYF